MRKRIGIYHLGGGAGSAGGTGRKSVAMAASLARKYDVTLICDPRATLAGFEQLYGVRLDGVRLFPLSLPLQRVAWKLLRSPAGRPLCLLRADSMLTNLKHDLDRTYYRQMRKLDLDVLINNVFASNLPCPAKRGIYMCMFPHPMRDQPRPDYGLVHNIYDAVINRFFGLTPQILDSYEVITANSSFTAGWIEKLWKRPSLVVYSAASDMGPPGAKQKIILHVGRFVSEIRSDYKHQITLLEAFRGLPELHRENWELHFVGSVLPEAATLRMMDKLRLDARDLPVRFHHAIGFDALRALYRQASIYWHATGYGKSPERQPRWQEHFGMTTVEAMSAGAVPVVIDSGGQRETVDHQITGFRWKSLEELREATLFLAKDPPVLAEFSRRAVAASAQFGSTAFTARIEKLVDSLTEVAPGDQCIMKRVAV
jgi:glycosyltransferase involved in cell wall biosynthesis